MNSSINQKYDFFKEEFITQYKDKYKKYLEEDISSLILKFDSEMRIYDNVVIDIAHEKTLKNMYFLKRRWFERYKCNKKHLKDIESVKFEFEQVENGGKSVEQFKNYYGVSNVNEYIKSKENSLITWRDEKNKVLSDFPFIHHLDKRAVNSALKYDLLIEYYKYIKEIQKGIADDIKRIPIFLDTLAIDPTNRKKLFDENELNLNDKYLEVFSYISEKEKELLLVQLEKDAYMKMQQGKNVQDIITQMALLKATDTMNMYDSKILSYIYTCFYNDILAEAITKQISEIMYEIGIEYNTPNRKKVINSIIKLSKLDLEYQVNETHLSGSLFDVYLEKDKGTKEISVKIQLGTFFKSIIYMNEGYNFNKTAYDNLSADSQHYALWLQKRRIKLCGENISEEIIDINTMLSAILWNTTRYDRKLKRVLLALQELKDNKMIIKDFSYNKKTYEVEIKYLELPIRIQERVKNHDFKASELVEGSTYIIK